MSFLTSFCDLPQKEQDRLPPPIESSRLRSIRSYQGYVVAGAVLLFVSGDDILFVGDHFVDDPVLLGISGTHEIVAFRVVADPVEGGTGVLGQEIVQLVPGPEYLLGVDVDVRRL